MMSVTISRLNIGIVGAGGFATFAASCFADLKGIKIVAVIDTNPIAAASLASAYAATAYTDLALFLDSTDIDLVYIATPPAFHYGQSMAALLAGKHVVCEKPAALIVSEAEELVELAALLELLYVVNLMQRYNPLFDSIKQVVDKNVLGDFTHGYFENYASDEHIPQDHWFWDDRLSGGIFIEHGVHFFDLFAGWLGPGELIYSAKWRRPKLARDIYDRTQAIVNYEKGPVTYYHGFDQPKVLDRQELKLQFERGDITLYGWIPVRLRINAIVDEDNLQAITRILGDLAILDNDRAEVTVLNGDRRESVTAVDRVAVGRFKEIRYTDYVSLTFGDDARKMTVYSDLLKLMIKDQWSWIIDRSAERTITGQNAIDSLRIAQAATSRAKIY